MGSLLNLDTLWCEYGPIPRWLLGASFCIPMEAYAACYFAPVDVALVVHGTSTLGKGLGAHLDTNSLRFRVVKLGCLLPDCMDFNLLGFLLLCVIRELKA